MPDKLSIHQTATDKAIRILEAIGAKYAIHIDGEVYGTLKVANESNRNRVYARGETRAHYWPIIENLNVGDSASVPFAHFDPKILASNISANCVHAWGAGNTMTARNDENQTIEVLRLG